VSHLTGAMVLLLDGEKTPSNKYMVLRSFRSDLLKGTVKAMVGGNRRDKKITGS
jgi:hypothetical protein